MKDCILKSDSPVIDNYLDHNYSYKFAANKISDDAVIVAISIIVHWIFKTHTETVPTNRLLASFHFASPQTEVKDCPSSLGTICAEHVESPSRFLLPRILLPL